MNGGKTKELNKLRNDLKNRYEYMQCGNLLEFNHRLQWLSEGMLKNHITNDVRDVKNMQEIALYQEFKDNREKLYQ
jgi:hypothetical protein